MTSYYSTELAQTEELHKSFFNRYLIKVYSCFALGMLISTVTSLLLSSFGVTEFIYNSPLAITVIAIVQIGLFFILTLLFNKIDVKFIGLLFFVYSLTTGISLSTFFYHLSFNSIILTLFVSTSMFGIMAIYGYLTKQDLSKFGSFALMGLIGIIMGSILNIFLDSNMLDWILSYLGIGMFLVLIALDMQKIKISNIDGETDIKNAVKSALSLYLNFTALIIPIERVLRPKN